MTAPRQVLAGSSYLITRRCSERRYFLTPSASTTQIFQYVLAVAAERYQIDIHAACVLSNHFHLVVTDPHARLPDFHRYLDGLVARAVNCALGRWESFWDPDSYSAVRLEDDQAVLDKLVYVLANPVAAGLVRRGREWPGLWSDPSQIGGDSIEVERPERFFREDGPMPAVAHLRFVRPSAFEANAGLGQHLRDLLREAEDQAVAKLEKAGRRFLGAARALAQRPGARPSTTEPRRTLAPQLASRNQWKRIEALLRLTAFRRAYRKARDAWRSGVRGVVFPSGTWLLRVEHGVTCAAG